MGDVHPAAVQGGAARGAGAALSRAAAPARAILGSSGSDAVEAALKTALLATGRAGVVAFEGAYHGLALGALDATWRPQFREPFRARLPGATVFARYGDADDALRAARAAPAADRRGAGRADPGPRRRAHPAAGLPARRCAASATREGWLLDRRRDLHRLRSHRPLVRLRARGRRARPALRRQGARLGHADLGLRRARASGWTPGRRPAARRSTRRPSSDTRRPARPRSRASRCSRRRSWCRARRELGAARSHALRAQLGRTAAAWRTCAASDCCSRSSARRRRSRRAPARARSRAA